MQNIRNFSIIAHIDHGKSTLADRLLQETGTVSARDMQEQFLDNIDIERERGITVKLQAVRMKYTPPTDASDKNDYILNLIDTPGHIDFSYEVNRALEACEGALLLVDAAQGIQAQTLANYMKAKDAGLTILPVINKIDLPAADPETVMLDMMETFGFNEEDFILTSAKTGLGIQELLDAIVAKIPAPKGDPSSSPKALVFDSFYDDYKGVVALIRVIDGSFTKNNSLTLMQSGKDFEPVEIGYNTGRFTISDSIECGEVGYIATGLKNIAFVRVGETITSAKTPATTPLEGYKEPTPMVFANLFPDDGDEISLLRDAVERLNLTDAAFTFTPIKSTVLGSGFRCGFLGLLHVEIIRDRIEQEFNVVTQLTSPSVLYYVTKTNGETISVQAPQDLPEPNLITNITEPWCTVKLYTPNEYLGGVMQIAKDHRGIQESLESMHSRTTLVYKIPLSDVISTFFDRIKSISSGYASFDYDVTEYRPVNLVRLDILLNKVKEESLSRLVVKERLYDVGEKMVATLKESLPRQQFTLPIQAAVGGTIVARETITAMRKDVTAKLYGGDRTRKDKLLKKQKAGKKRMQETGRVRVTPEVYRKILGV